MAANQYRLINGLSRAINIVMEVKAAKYRWLSAGVNVAANQYVA